MDGEGQVKEKPPCVENPSSSALTSTVMIDGVQYRFKLRSSESTISGSLAPKSSHYVDLSEYPPGTDIEHELHWDGARVVSKVPRWAHEKWLLKHQNAGDPDVTTAAAGTKALKRPCENLVDNPSATAVAYGGGKRPREDHSNPSSATAAASGTKALKQPSEDLVENPLATAAAYGGGKSPCEDRPNSASASATAASVGAKDEDEDLDFFAYPYAYPVRNARGYEDFAGKYVIVVEEGCRLREVVYESAAPFIRIGGTPPPSTKPREGVWYNLKQVPEVMELP